tara:strand:- start:81 stop:392 length:312 start_codon:yes stop_codon:yes gene_type:complete
MDSVVSAQQGYEWYDVDVGGGQVWTMRRSIPMHPSTPHWHGGIDRQGEAGVKNVRRIPERITSPVTQLAGNQCWACGREWRRKPGDPKTPCSRCGSMFWAQDG